MTSFSYNLRKLREFRNLSPQQMADKLGQSVRTYLKNESGERDMTRLELKAAAEMLEVTESVMLNLGEYMLSDILYSLHEKSGKLKSDLKQELTGRLENRISFLERKLEQIEKQLFTISTAV